MTINLYLRVKNLKSIRQIRHLPLVKLSSWSTHTYTHSQKQNKSNKKKRTFLSLPYFILSLNIFKLTSCNLLLTAEEKKSKVQFEETKKIQYKSLSTTCVSIHGNHSTIRLATNGYCTRHCLYC